MTPKITRSVISMVRCVMSMLSAANGSNHEANVVAMP